LIPGVERHLADVTAAHLLIAVKTGLFAGKWSAATHSGHLHVHRGRRDSRITLSRRIPLSTHGCAQLIHAGAPERIAMLLTGHFNSR
jgi:hypothetical protein